MHDEKKSAKHDVLKKLIQMAQEMMMEGHGDDEEAGNKLSDAMKEGSLAEEAAESPEEEKAEGDDMDADEFGDYKKKEMKRGLRSPIKDRKVAIMVAARPAKMSNAKGRY